MHRIATTILLAIALMGCAAQPRAPQQTVCISGFDC
jgi:hypothetical protein